MNELRCRFCAHVERNADRDTARFRLETHVIKKHKRQRAALLREVAIATSGSRALEQQLRRLTREYT